MITFTPNKVAFGRHETFHMRFGWLSKGYRSWCEAPELFEQEDATVVLGVGKNMVSSIRYWLEAAQIVQSSAATGVVPTDIGSRVFAKESGWDPYLEDDATLWLVHWLIASNPRDATTFYWFFNRFYKPEFSAAELLSAVSEFAKEQIKNKVAATTLKHDISALLRMYAPSDDAKGQIEERLDSPLSILGLLRRSPDGKFYTSHFKERRRLPVAVFAYAVMELFEHMQNTQLPIETLVHASQQIATPGSVFRLSEEGVVQKLEEMCRWMPGVIELRETAGIHQVYLVGNANKFDAISKHYGVLALECAA